MKIKSLVAVLTIASIAPFAQSAEDAAAPKPEAAPAPVASAETELKALVGKINAKIRDGSTSETALAPELKEFDQLIAAHEAEKSETVARAAFMRALLYIQVLKNFDRGEALLAELKQKFPGTEPAAHVDDIIAKLATQKEANALQSSLHAGVAFPDFNEKDLTGAPLSISQYKGKIVLVDFWATWCGPCVGELPNVLAAYEKYHAKGFEIVGISLDQSESKLKTFIAEKKMPWQQYFDGKGWGSKLGQKYGVNSIPATYLLDRDGKIIAKDLRGEALEKELERLLAAK